MWLFSLVCFGQSYPSPHYNNLTVDGTATFTARITYPNLAQAGANTVLANATGSTANLMAFSMPSCSTSASALNWTTSTGFTCNTAVLASNVSGIVIAANGGTGRSTLTAHGVLVGEGTSAINQLAVGTTGQMLVGVTGADPAFGNLVSLAGVTGGACAASGIIGECINSNIPAGSAVSLTTVTAANVTSVSLTAGNWICYGNVVFSPGGTTITSQEAGWIGTVSATLPTAPNSGSYFGIGNLSNTAGGNSDAFPVGMIMENVTSTTTIYLEAYSTFNTSTMSAYGYINCLRIH